jgi:thiamine kinase
VAAIPDFGTDAVIGAALLRRIPGCEHGDPPIEVKALRGGRGVNSILRVTTPEGRFVLRERREPVRRPGAPPEQELLAHTLAADAGVAPRVFDAAPDGRWMLMEYVDAPAWTSGMVMAPLGLELLCRQLQVLHRLPAPSEARLFDPVAIAQSQFETIARTQPDRRRAAAQLVARVIARVHSQAEESARLPATGPVLNHGDLQSANILGPALLVDWEYAQWTDPAWDVAVLLTYHPLLHPRSRALLEAVGLEGQGQQARLERLLELFGALNDLWALAEAPPARA